MSYRNIIADNCKNHSVVSWWPRFAYHYTDITNAVNILSSGFIYSRLNAQQSGVMKNDNASRQVIDVTNFDTVSSVRFYFRPMTHRSRYSSFLIWRKYFQKTESSFPKGDKPEMVQNCLKVKKLFQN